ncbi:ABC transporter permease, partial [Paraglaciecola sp.]|uniref:ABC transporter permease n=2 Tax=Paraglaciecola sp. TaxID=1920173 RepID=UPI003296C798
AFIHYLEDASQVQQQKLEKRETTTASKPADIEPVINSNLAASSLPKKAIQGFSLTRLLAYSYLEVMEVMRDPVRIAFAFFGSAILLLVVAYGISLDVEDLRFAALDNDQSPESRQYLSHFSGSYYFLELDELHSVDEVERRLKANDISLAIEIPSGFGQDLKNGHTPVVSVWIDGANTLRSGTIEGYVEGSHARYLTQLATDAGIDASAALKVSLQPRFVYNPSFESIYSFGPKTPALLLLMFPAILMAVSIAREKEIGTITNFYVAPTRPLEFLLGKQLPYLGIGLANFFILTLLVVFVLQVPIKGSLVGLTLGAFLYVFAATGFGLLMSSITKSQVAAVFATTILTAMPTISFSGLLQPISTLEGGAYFIGTIWPATYYLHLSVAAFTKGLSFYELGYDLIILAIMGPILVTVATMFLKKQEA